jgi:DNA replication protein DnaC
MIVSPCSICGDIGRVYNTTTDSVINCVCWPQKVGVRALEKAGIRRDYWDATFELFDPRQEYPNQQQVLDFCRLYADKWLENKEEGRCLSILGPKTSMGKSHLAVAICHHLIKTYWTKSVVDQDVCMFVNVTNWFLEWNRFHAKFPAPPHGSPLWADLAANPEFTGTKSALGRKEDRMFSTELLVLDDLSKFDPHQSRLDKLYAVIDHRVSNRLPIVVTDNTPSWAMISKKFGDDYGPPIADRLARNGDTVVVELPMLKRRKKS